MMKTGRVTMCCVALLFALTSVSAVQKCRSINALKKINFGQSVPKHSLVLLYWFANTVNIDENNNIWLTFDPNREDYYGLHHYGNYGGLLEPLPRGNVYRYYTIGNLYLETSMQLPSYVVHPPATEYVGSNMDRIIIRVREPNAGQRAQQRIDQVYITQHYDTSENLGTEYDPDHTYMITINLLRQIREFSVVENQQQLLQLGNRFGSNADDSQLRDITNTWATNLAGLGLLLYIVIQEKYSSNQRNNRKENRQTPVDNVSKSKRNVPKVYRNAPRDFHNHGYVPVNIDEDHEANRPTWNRESGINSVPRDRKRKMFCCIAICIAICLIIGVSLCIYFLYWRR